MVITNRIVWDRIVRQRRTSATYDTSVAKLYTVQILARHKRTLAIVNQDNDLIMNIFSRDFFIFIIFMSYFRAVYKHINLLDLT